MAETTTDTEFDATQDDHLVERTDNSADPAETDDVPQDPVSEDEAQARGRALRLRRRARGGDRMTPSLVRPIPSPARPGTAAAYLAVLTSQLGYREGPDNDTVFGREYGLNNAAWCAMFLHWGAVHSGCDRVIPTFAYTPAGAAGPPSSSATPTPPSRSSGAGSPP